MKKTHSLGLLLVALVGLVPPVVAADQDATNRLTFSGRFGLNISAKFKNLRSAPPGNPRTTPDGDPYNYDDGYVLTDVSGNAGGQTWYWGYDNSASQISGNTILMNRSTPVGHPAARTLEDDPYLGAELTYNRLLGVQGKARYGLEVAANYLNLSLNANRTFSGTVSRLTDAYPFTPGTTPPAATPASPYQGSFNGPGFLLGDTPVSSTTTLIPGATITDAQRLDANLWGFRLGPYVELPLSERWNLYFSGGLATGLLDSEVAWTQTIGASSTRGGGHALDVLWGFYAGANVSWRFSEHWSAIGGAQFQSLGNYQHAFGGRKVEMDFSNSVFLTLGLGYNF